MKAPLPTTALVEAAQTGDEAARERLMSESLPTVIGWCARLGGPKVDPEDAAHDVLIVVLTRLGRLRDTDRFGSWLFGITRRVLAKHRRRAWVRNWVPGLELDAVDDAETPSEAAEQSELAQQVEAILAQLPPNQREVLVLCDVEDRTDVAVAELLELPVGTVKSRLRLARNKFRKMARGRVYAPHIIGLSTWGQG